MHRGMPAGHHIVVWPQASESLRGLFSPFTFSIPVSLLVARVSQTTVELRAAKFV